MTPEIRAAAQVALAKHVTYLDPPTIPPGMTCAEYRLSQGHKRTRWQRLVRRLNGH